MRWLLGRGERTCHACGAALERGALWCGACGARADQPPDQDHRPAAPAASTPDATSTGDAADAAASGGEGSDDGQTLRRRTLVVLVVVGLTALVVASQVRAPTPEPLLGHLGANTGMSATGPPPTGLRLAWAHEPPARGNVWYPQSVPQDLAVRDGRARVGNLVLDLADGHLARVGPDVWGVHGAEHAIIDGRDLVVLDALTGAVRTRAPLPGGWADGPVWAAHRGDGTTLLRSDEDSVLVADDGSIVAEVEGVFVDYVDRALQEPAAFPLRDFGRGGGGGGSEPNSSLRLVAVATGDTVVDLPAGQVRLADVMGDLALVASTDALVDLSGGTPTAGEVHWTVQLLDARTGQPLHDLTVVSREGPRLLGTFADGTIVIGTRLADEYALLAVRPDGAVSSLAEVGRLRDEVETGMYPRSTVLNVAVVTGDVLAALDGDGALIGLDRTGSRVWELAAPGVAGLRGADGHLALVPGGEDRGRVRVVRASDGEVVGSVQPPEDPWAIVEMIGFPFATLDGRVGISHAGGPGAPHQVSDPLVLTRWLDLRTGERATFQDVFAPYTGNGDEVGTTWALHGIVTDELGQEQPVVSRIDQQPTVGRTRPRQTVELLEPGEGLRTYELPLPEVDADYFSGLMVVGATTQRFAVWHEGGGPSSAQVGTLVLDRTTGATTTIEGVLGLVLLDGLLLGQEIDSSYTATSLVALDPATGEQLWSSASSEPFAWSDRLRVDDELIIDIGPTRLTARSTRDGSRLWTHTSDTELSGEVVLGPRHVVITATDGQVVALDRTDGTVAWRAALGTPVASLTGAGDHVLVGTHDGLIVHLDARGREVQRVAVGSGAVHAVAALGETVTAVVDQRVVALRPDGTGITRDDEVELP